MKFVIFSYNFLPANDAEAYCTTRFASALVRMGHDVHVVTIEREPEVSEDVWHLLEDSNLKITHVRQCAGKALSIYTRMRYFIHELGSVNIASSIKAVKKVLKENPDAILITRSVPFISLIVGWHCRMYAKKWIAHFSDPISHLPRSTFWSKIRYMAMRFWLERTFRDANLLSFTCKNVKRYYHDEHGEVFDKTKSIVVNHIGEPMLPCHARFDKPENQGRIIAHAGSLSQLRGSKLLVEAIQSLNAKGMECICFQCGVVDSFTQDLIEKYPRFIEQKISNDPDFATAVCNSVDAIFIADQDTEWGYIPFIPSKFAYQIFTDTPIVILTREGSCMYKYAKKYSNAGLFLADYSKSGSLASAIKAAFACEHAKIDRSELRCEFSQKGVVDKFVADIKRLLQ